MQTRRKFLGSGVLATLAGLVGLGPACSTGTAAEPHDFDNPRFKKLFRWTEVGPDTFRWRQILWEDVRAGDRLIIIGIEDHQLNTAVMCLARTDASGQGLTTGFEHLPGHLTLVDRYGSPNVAPLPESDSLGRVVWNPFVLGNDPRSPALPDDRSTGE